MDTAYILIGALSLDFVVGVLNFSRDKEQINKMQTQINELCRAIGHEELVSTYISEEEKN